MKKFTKILACFMLVLFGITLFACEPANEKDKAFTYPDVNDNVYGNGGLAVQMGDYLYFANGFMSANDSKHNQKLVAGKDLGSLVLTKLTNGYLSTDDNGSLIEDDYLNFFNRLSGFEATDLYISHGYLYFTTQCQANAPSSEHTGATEWAKKRVNFNRIKIDKSTSVETIYTTSAEYTNIEFEYFESDNNTFILIYEKGTSLDKYNGEKRNNMLKRIDCNSKSNVVVDYDVTSVNLHDKNVFYGKSSDENFLITNYDVLNNEKLSETEKIEQYTIMFADDNYLYATKYSTSNANLYRSNLNSKTDFELFAVCIGDGSYSLYLDNGNVIAVGENKLLVYKSNETSNEPTKQMDLDGTVNPIGLYNSSVVYHDGTSIKMVSWSNLLNDGTAEIINVVSDLTEFKPEYFDIDQDNGYLYFYKTNNSHDYLYRVELVKNSEIEIVGVLLESDIPSEETKN